MSLFWFPALLCYQNENFADAGREPVTFENPLYSTATGAAGDAAVIHATQVKQDSTHTTLCPFNTTHWPTFSKQRQMVHKLLCFCIQTGDCEYKWWFNRECICKSHVQWTAAGNGGEKYPNRPQDNTGKSRSKVAKSFKTIACIFYYCFFLCFRSPNGTSSRKN